MADYGFGVRITAPGVKTFVLQRLPFQRADRPQLRVTT